MACVVLLMVARFPAKRPDVVFPLPEPEVKLEEHFDGAESNRRVVEYVPPFDFVEDVTWPSACQTMRVGPGKLAIAQAARRIDLEIHGSYFQERTVPPTTCISSHAA